jgi:hypothetical protein
MSYFSQAVHRAWRDHHPDGGEASRRNGSSDISVGICVIRQTSELGHGHIGLVTQGAFARLCYDQMGFNLQCARHLQQPDAISDASRAADPYYEPWALHD